MDVFEQVQQIKPENVTDDRDLSAARERLMSAIGAERRPARSRASRRPWIIAGGLVGATAAVTVGVLVVSGFTSPAPTIEAVPTREPGPRLQSTATPEPSPEPLTASAALRGAAQATATGGGPVAGEGQYLRVEHSTEQLVLYAEGSGYTPFDASRSNATAAWVVSGRYVTYIPADRSGEWVRIFEPEYRAVALYGVGPQLHFDEWSSSFTNDEPIVLRSVDGLGDRYPGSSEPLQGSDAYYAQVPRDPAQLIDWLRASLQGTEPELMDSSLIWSIVEILELNAAPSDLRSALYLALDLVPGSEIVSIEGDVVTIGFRPPGGLDWRETVSIDRATGMLVGSTRTFGAGSPIVPDDVPNFRLTNTITVVDSAP